MGTSKDILEDRIYQYQMTLSHIKNVAKRLKYETYQSVDAVNDDINLILKLCEGGKDD